MPMSYSAGAQSMLHSAQLRGEGRKLASLCCGFESVYIKAVQGVSVETLRIAASYASSKALDDMWYHAPPFHAPAPSTNSWYQTKNV